MKLVNQQVIKNANMKQIYNLIYQKPGISRAALSKHTNLSKPAVSSLVDELIAQRFIYDSGAADTTSVGRRPNSLQLYPEQNYVAVLAYKDNSITLSLVDIVGTSILFESREISSNSSYAKLSYHLVYDFALSKIKQEQLLGISVIVPAMIDSERKEIFTTTMHLPTAPSENIILQLQELFQEFPVAIVNDTACFAYAEKIYTHVTEKDFAFINFNRGIGATLFIGNEMLGKACASYTQFGHYSLDPQGKPCSCGNKGCLELVIGEDSIRERVKAEGRNTALNRISKVTYKDLGQASIYGDLTAQKIICDMADDFSIALNNLICMVHPKLIVLGGKGKELGPLFLEHINQNLKSTGFRRMVDSVGIRYSYLDFDACFNGAMKYFFDIHYNFTQDMAGKFFIG